MVSLPLTSKNEHCAAVSCSSAAPRSSELDPSGVFVLEHAPPRSARLPRPSSATTALRPRTEVKCVTTLLLLAGRAVEIRGASAGSGTLRRLVLGRDLDLDPASGGARSRGNVKNFPAARGVGPSLADGVSVSVAL